MRLQVEGHAKEFFPDGRELFEIELASPATVREMLGALKISPDLVMAVFINGDHSDKDAVPPDGATVILLSPPAGG